MKKLHDALKIACLVALTLAVTTAPAAPRGDVEDAMRRDGLEKIKVKDVELAYARPGATLARYQRVRLDPVEVEFRKARDPARTGSAVKLTDAERDKIRTGVARLVHEEFAKELQNSSAYRIASDSGADVLRVKAKVLDLYVNAPDVGVARSRTLVSSAGEMTLRRRALRFVERPGAGTRRRSPRSEQGRPDARRQRCSQRRGSAQDRRRLGAHRCARHSTRRTASARRTPWPWRARATTFVQGATAPSHLGGIGP
jgi:hypothetical protein